MRALQIVSTLVTSSLHVSNLSSGDQLEVADTLLEEAYDDIKESIDKLTEVRSHLNPGFFKKTVGELRALVELLSSSIIYSKEYKHLNSHAMHELFRRVMEETKTDTTTLLQEISAIRTSVSWHSLLKTKLTDVLNKVNQAMKIVH